MKDRFKHKISHFCSFLLCVEISDLLDDDDSYFLFYSQPIDLIDFSKDHIFRTIYEKNVREMSSSHLNEENTFSKS